MEEERVTLSAAERRRVLVLNRLEKGAVTVGGEGGEGGEGGIRTRGGLHHTAFRERHLKPLGHLSAAEEIVGRPGVDPGGGRSFPNSREDACGGGVSDAQ